MSAGKVVIYNLLDAAAHIHFLISTEAEWWLLLPCAATVLYDTASCTTTVYCCAAVDSFLLSNAVECCFYQST